MPHVREAFSRAMSSYQKGFELFRNGTLWLNADGKILGANRKICEDLGYSKEELLEMVFFEINPFINLFSWKKTWGILCQKREYQVEAEFITRDGLLIPVRMDALMIVGPDHEWAMVVVENLMDSNRLIDILEVMAGLGKVGGWEYDAVKREFTLTGQCLKWLDLEGNLLTFKKKDLLKMLLPRLGKAQTQELIQRFRNSLTSNDSFEQEVIGRQGESTFGRYVINGMPQRSDTGQALKLFGAVKDISDFEAKTEDLYLSQFTIDNANEMIFWVRPDGSFFYVNHAVCERLGYTRQELMKLTSIDLAPAFTNVARETMWEELRRKKYMEYQIELTTKSGKTFPAVSTLNYIKFKDQEFNCVFTRDYSERHKEEEELRLMQFALNNAGEMVLWVDADGNIINFNQAFCKKTGYSEAEVREMSVYQLYDSPNAPEKRAMLWQKLREEKQIEIESDLVLKDGTKIPVYCSLNYVNYQGRELDCIFMRDWRGKQKRDEQLMLAQKTFETTTALIIWTDEEKKIKFVNPAACRLLKYNPRSLLNKPLSIICPEMATSNDLHEDSSLKEMLFLDKNNREIPIELSIQHIEHHKNAFIGIIGRDISMRKKQEKALKQAFEQIEHLSQQLDKDNVLLREEIGAEFNFNDIITSNKVYRQLLQQIVLVADSDTTVLILGETGTGKELLARAIHSLSAREKKVMVKVNCAALPEHLIESELFGHEKGAFTGAIHQKKGRFEMADGGTLFLDEIGEMPLDLQSKLLRVLQEGEFERVGGEKTIHVNVRVVAATNKNLEKMVKEGLFREDLYYRLNVFPIKNMPLRERKEDIPLLVRHFVKKYGDRSGKKITEISPADLKLLEQYDFPGNVRELENIVERAVVLTAGKVLNIRASFARQNEVVYTDEDHSAGAFLSFEDMQRKHILKALQKTNWRVTGPHGAAKLLGLNDRTLVSKMQKLDINREDYLSVNV
ncbi:MAG TPA: sigma 54-interacting transcriptional regulator [Saprospiraceae bacterium]|mgnify:CR=1 FL=1|nr:sigma 54-interacting transcriptional regulator [Saprospiraceae bacterium]HMQ84683.1 sigma 54-interacting transcriptional regulator [Saprospiraceae bacterium]